MNTELEDDLMPDEEDKQNDTRKVLEPYEGRRMWFLAEVGPPGTRDKNQNLPTLCLYNLYLRDDHGQLYFVSDHVWVDRSNALDKAFVKRGARIEFKADVVHYMKGGPKTISTRYGRRRLDMPYTGSDYGLRRVGCVRVADKIGDDDDDE